MSTTLRYNILLPFAVIIVILAGGCAPIYMPTSPNTPMLKESGETKVEMNATSSGFEFKGAHAVNVRMAIAAMVSGASDPDEAGDESSFHRYAEASFINYLRPGSMLVIENSGGLGVGGGKGHGQKLFTDGTFIAEGMYFKPFLQNNLALQTRVVDIGLVNRLSVIRFTEIRSTLGDAEPITDPSTPLFWEPAIITQLGWDRFRINAHVGISTPLTGEPDFDWQGMLLGVGLGYRFGS